MSSRFRALPQVPTNLDPQTRAFLSALKENIEVLAGMRGDSNIVEQLLGYAPVNKAGDTIDGDITLGGVLLNPACPSFFGSLGVPTANAIHPITAISSVGFDLTTNKITVKTPGRYRFSAQQLVNPNGPSYLALRKNGNTVVHGYTTGSMMDIGSECILEMAVGDYFDLYWQGNAPTNALGGEHSSCCISMIG